MFEIVESTNRDTVAHTSGPNRKARSGFRGSSGGAGGSPELEISGCISLFLIRIFCLQGAWCELRIVPTGR